MDIFDYYIISCTAMVPKLRFIKNNSNDFRDPEIAQILFEMRDIQSLLASDKIVKQLEVVTISPDAQLWAATFSFGTRMTN